MNCVLLAVGVEALRAPGGLDAFLDAIPPDQVALMTALARRYAPYLRWPRGPRAADAAGDALSVALHHLSRLAIQDKARSRKFGLFLRRGRLRDDPCFPCDFRPEPPPAFYACDFPYPETSAAQVGDWGY